jgi:hypothetical protein
MADDHTNEVDLVVKYASHKGGGEDGQLIIDDVELERSRDNRTRHGIGNSDPQVIEAGNNEYTFSASKYMNKAAADALERMYAGDARTDAVYVKDSGVFTQEASGMTINTLNVSASDGGDTMVQVDADLLGLDMSSG